MAVSSVASMAKLNAYLPIFLLVVATVAILLATAADRRTQLTRIADVVARRLGGGRNGLRLSGLSLSGLSLSGLSLNSLRAIKRRLGIKRIAFWLVVLYLLSYIWTYQRAQDAIAVELATHDIAEVEIGSLVIPYLAFFKSTYRADAGFTKSKKRARADLAISGHPWRGIEARIDETGLANINKITGQKFVFSYLTDVKILRPAIDRHMQQLVRGNQIAGYEIETFDNRGPYLIVALHPNNRSKEVNAVAATLAQGLHTSLTKTNQLKVNQVVIKIVDPEPYITAQTITVIGRGTAGNY